MDIFNRSSLGARLKQKLTLRQFLRVLKGMNSDHASTEKGTAKG
jgi:hypothetical protein